jgi:hypothetical protein
VADQPITIAEEIAAAGLRQMIRRGYFDLSDVEALCEGLTPGAEAVMRALFLEAGLAPASEVAALLAREGFRVVGNEGETR